jgi:hypothetical protein
MILMRRAIKFEFVFLIMTIFLSGCEKKDELPDVKIDQDLIREINSKSLGKVTIDNHDYILETYLYRDFMPISPPDGKPLISVNCIMSSDSSAIPDNIKMLQQYVISGDSVWVADYQIETPSTLGYKNIRISNNGPKWGPGIKVDVIAKITDINTGHDYYLKQEDVLIFRTD